MKVFPTVLSSRWMGASLCFLLLAASLGCEMELPSDTDDSASDAPTVVEAMGTSYTDQFDGPHADHLTMHSVTLPDKGAVGNHFDDGVAQFDYPDPFQQVGLQFDATDIGDLSYRARQDDGSWSGWEAVDIFFSEGHIHNGLIVLDEPTTAVEISGAHSLEFLHLEFFDEVVARDSLIRSPGPLAEGAAGDADDDVATTRQQLAPSSLVTSRYGWGAIDPGKICGNVVAPYRMSIHHTAQPSSDGGNAAARMRSMQSYHINSNGWCDIGYHFVVAQSGEIFQGRSRSNRPGAHVGGQNSGNVGISLIGNYTSTAPPSGQVTSAGAIVEWVHDTYSIPLNRTAIKGHREWPGQWTNCPGNHGLNAIDDIIAEADSGAAPPPPPPPPEPDPGGCTPVEDDDAGGSLFADMPTDVDGYDEATMLYNAGITTGCNSSPLMFCPDCPVSRAAMVTLLVRAAELDTSNPPDTPSFSDVSPDSTFYPYIEAAYEAGITNGCGNGEFCGGDEISRAAAASMIHRAAGWPDEVASDAPSFSDVDPGYTHYEAIETLKQRCVTQGYPNGEYRPNNNVPRRVAAIFVARAFNLENNNPCAEPGGCTPQAAFDTTGSEFADMPVDQFGYDEALLLYDEGITTGCSDSPTMFCPNCPTRRAPMVTLLVRAADLDISNPPAQPTFDDVGTDSTFYPYVEAAYEAGITNGCGDGVFCPMEPVTRQAVAAMVTRALDWELISPDVASFDDVSEEHFFYDHIETMADRCVTSGCQGGASFCPNREVPRAHAAIFTARAFNLDDINPCALDPEEPDNGEDPGDGDGDSEGDGNGGDGDGNGDGDGDGGDGDSSGESSMDDGATVQASGCGCSSTTSDSNLPGAALALFLVGMALMRRRNKGVDPTVDCTVE